MLALTHPDRVSRLVIVDVAPVARPPSLRAFAQALLNLDLTTLESRMDADRKLKARIPDPAVRLFLLQNLVQKDGQWAWRVNLLVLEKAMDQLSGFPDTAALSPFPGPTLFISGQNSDYIRPEHHALIRRLFPRAVLEEIPDAGHWVHADQPAAFTAAVRKFLSAEG
nr:alpha/beta fold hydrolase [Pseudomonadota bacterium]